MYGGRAGDADGGGADAASGQRRDGPSWLAWMSIRPGRHVPSSEDLPGQPVAVKCPERPRGGAGPAAEFVRQFCFRRQPGPRRVFAAPDPPREHGVNVQPGPPVLSRIIHDQPHRQCKWLQPRRTAHIPSGTPARGRTYGVRTPVVSELSRPGFPLPFLCVVATVSFAVRMPDAARHGLRTEIPTS